MIHPLDQEKLLSGMNLSSKKLVDLKSPSSDATSCHKVEHYFRCTPSQILNNCPIHQQQLAFSLQSKQTKPTQKEVESFWQVRTSSSDLNTKNWCILNVGRITVETNPLSSRTPQTVWEYEPQHVPKVWLTAHMFMNHGSLGHQKLETRELRVRTLPI